MLSRFEITRLISARALQLSLGAPSLVKTTKVQSIYDVARMEFEEKIIPLAVHRKMPDGRVERERVM
ncbi:MAG: DNA-directed RNA polymerase subunit K [Ignavibacteria bacterium CG08_land_8_20_14_0_20_37_9]|nr:MAG: DNA-directed RNA polymerase subunit K [Ignavibacteria bacterium CG08_land_8_20_14_0_20_37_9]